MNMALIASTSSLRLGAAEWAVIAVYAAGIFALGLRFSRAATRSADGFLIGERKLPWWVIGFANAATYSDSGGGWVWLFYVGGFMYLNQIAWITWPIWMPLVGVYWAKLWRRSGLVTTGELIEFRYSGRGAAVFRGFYGLYACLAWATIFLGYGTALLAQMLAPLIGWSPAAVVLVFGAVTLSYTLMGGLLGAAYIDVPQFFIFFIAAFLVLYFGIQEHGSYAALLERAAAHRDASFWQIYPPSSGSNHYVDIASLAALVLIGLFLAGSPCAGEGWTAQRCLAARDERHAVFGQMFNCVLSLVVRLIPLLPLGVLAISLFPATGAAHETMTLPGGGAAPSIGVWSQLVVRYADRVPGFGGLMIVAVVAGYMSTVATLLQWGSAFVVNDVYRRHLRPGASDREYIRLARLVMMAMMVLATGLALGIADIGPWVVFINVAMIAPALPLSWLRWFWWRLNVWGEVFGILISAPLAAFVWFGLGWNDRPIWQPTLLLLGAGFCGSVLPSLVTRAEQRETLRQFYLKVRPPGAWGPIRRELEAEGLIDAGRQRREFAWDLRAAACGIVFCFSLTWALFTAVVLRWTEAAVMSVAAAASGWAYYACWLRSRAALPAPVRAAHAGPSAAAPVASLSQRGVK